MGKKNETALCLKDVIRSVQTQLMESEKEREQMELPPLFTVKEVEIEMNFVVERSFAAQTEANIIVVDASGEAGYRKEEINRIKVTLSTDISNTDNMFRKILSPGARPDER